MYHRQDTSNLGCNNSKLLMIVILKIFRSIPAMLELAAKRCLILSVDCLLVIKLPFIQTMSRKCEQVCYRFGVIKPSTICSAKETSWLAHRVMPNSLLNARPMTIRLISLVPAPISYSFASRRRRPTGISFVYPVPPMI